MKIKVEEIKDLMETEVIIKCKEKDDNVEKIISTLRLFESTLIVKKDQDKFVLTLNDILYFESVDDKVFCYTLDEVYESFNRLYEIEEIFKNSFLIRISKSMLLNVNYIKSFKSTLNGRMEAILINNDKVEVSRNYVFSLKLLLGGKTK